MSPYIVLHCPCPFVRTPFDQLQKRTPRTPIRTLKGRLVILDFQFAKTSPRRAFCFLLTDVFVLPRSIEQDHDPDSPLTWKVLFCHDIDIKTPPFPPTILMIDYAFSIFLWYLPYHFLRESLFVHDSGNSKTLFDFNSVI